MAGGSGRGYRRAVGRVELLLRSPLFAAMPRAVVDALAARAIRRHARRGQRVLARRDAAVVVLLVGRLEVVADDQTIVRSLVPPATVGISLAAGAHATAEILAADDSELVILPADAIAAALRRHPEAALAALVHLGGVIGELSAELAALRQHGLVERLRHRLRVLGAGRRELAITHARLAEEIGGTRANVSRALARLEREGVLRRHRGRIELR
jgi:CRP-like cAMP-binding protein